MSTLTKKKLVETKDGCICVPGEPEEYELYTDAANETKVVTKTRKRPYSKDKASSSSECSSTSIKDRLRSNKNKPKEDEDVKPTFPPSIDFTLNQDKRAIAPCPFFELRNKKYFVDKTNLIREIYTDESRAKFYFFPRAGMKSTVVDALIEWLMNDDKRRVERLECFKGLKITEFAKDAKGDVPDGAIGFNQHIVVKADFAKVHVDENTFEEIIISVTEEFCKFLVSRYSLSDVVIAELLKLKADGILFFDTLVDRVRAALPQTTPNRPVLLIIDNFDAPALRLLNRSKSTELALRVMSFFNRMLNDVDRLSDKLFHKVILFGTHQPIGLNTKSNLKKIPVESYPYGRKEICSNFFFSTEEVKTVLKNHGEDETKVTDLAKMFGQYNVDDEDYFHPGCTVNYITRQQRKFVGTERPAYWCSVDSLDILSNISSMLRFEMPLWTYHEDTILRFQYKLVLIHENLMRNPDTAYDTAYTYLLEAGYLTRIKNTDPPTYRIVNEEARNLFAARYEQWCERIPLEPDHQPFRYFAAQDYKGFFAMANDILKTKYAGEDFQYEGQYHVYLSSFFHNMSNWHFKSNYQAGYGKYDFVTWSLDPLVSTGYLFEIAIVKPEHDPMKHIRNKIIEKQKQVQDKEYFVEVKKEKVKCIVVVGCRKMLSYFIFEIKSFISVYPYVNKITVRKFNVSLFSKCEHRLRLQLLEFLRHQLLQDYLFSDRDVIVPQCESSRTISWK